MIDYNDLTNTNETTQEFINKTLYFLARHITKFIKREDHTNKEFSIYSNEGPIIAMIMSYKGLSSDNEQLLENYGINNDISISMKRLTSEISDKEMSYIYNRYSNLFNISEDIESITPEMIINKNLKLFLRKTTNREEGSGLINLFNNQINMYNFIDELDRIIKTQKEQNKKQL